MAITVTTTTVSASNSDSLTISKPSGVAVGDTLLIVASGEGTNYPSCSGFSTMLDSGTTGSYSSIRILYRIADSSDVSASTYSITQDGAKSQGAATMFCVKGIGSTNPLYASATARDTQDLASWSVGASSLTLGRPNEQLLIMSAQFAGDSNSGSFGTYTITSSDSNPTWTEVQDVQYAINDQPAYQAFAVAYAITTDISTITEYSIAVSGATTGTSDYVNTMLAVLVAPLNQTGTNNLLEVSPTVFSNTGVDVGGNGTNALLEVSPTIQTQNGDATSPSVWSPDTKPSTTWTPESK